MCILTTLTMVLCSISIYGLKHFSKERPTLGLGTVYVKSVLILVLTTTLIGYSYALYLFVKEHITPWYRWWNRCKIVKIYVSTRISEEGIVINTPESANKKLQHSHQSININMPTRQS